MSQPSPADPSRRDFVKTASLAGAAMLAGAKLASAQEKKELPPLAPPDKQPPDLQVPEPNPKRVGWGIVGLGKLAVEEILPAFAESKRSKPTALVSGHPDKAEKLAAVYGVDPKKIYNYDNFDEIVNDPAIDVIYIVLPNSMHAEYTIRALKAGKYVLCEKPMAVTAAECEQMIAVAEETDRKLMIAYRLQYEPHHLAVIDMCRKKKFGDISSIASSNCQDVQAPNIRLSKKLGGGPLGDIGIYSINAFRYITGEEPTEVTAFARQPKDDPRFREVPEAVSYTLRFPSGIVANAGCSFASAESRYFRVHCQQGYIDMDPAFSYTGLELRTKGPQGVTEHQLPQVNHFASEMDHFSTCILEDQPPRTPGEEGLADMRVIEALYKAIETGQATKVG